MSVQPVISVKGIAKNFGGVKAIRRMDIDLFPGEVNAVLGENGAGKSTLVNILAGNIRPDHGEILVHGVITEISNLTSSNHGENHERKIVWKNSFDHRR